MKTIEVIVTAMLLISLVSAQTTTTTTLPHIPWTEAAMTAKTSVAYGIPLTHRVAGNGSIQAAIDSANPGDTIIVSPGIYMERIILNKPLKLISGNQSAIIDGGDKSTGACVLINADSVEFTGFALTNCYTGVIVYPTEGVVVSNLLVIDVLDGLVAYEPTRMTVERNRFIDNIYAVYLMNTNESIVSKNNISDTWFGIWLVSSSRNLVEKNQVDTDKTGFGILLNFDSYENRISKNILTDNYWGVLIESGQYNILEKNVMCANTWDIRDQAVNNIYTKNYCNTPYPGGLCAYSCAAV